MNKLLKCLLLGVAATFLVAGSSMAMSFTDDYWTNTDYTTYEDGTSGFQLQVEQAGYESSFGLYTVNETGDAIVKEYTIFDPWDEPSYSVRTLNFRETAGNWEVQLVTTVGGEEVVLKAWESFSNTFGFFYGVDTGTDDNYPNNEPDGEDDSIDFFFYTDTQFNRLLDGTPYDVGYEHIGTDFYATSSTLHIYLDDQGSTRDPGPDRDFTDMTVYGNDLAPAPVPEPATMLLFGVGLLGVAGVSRRKMNN